MIPTIDNIFDGSLDIISWADNLKGYHDIYYSDSNSDIELLSIPYAELRAYHPRLLDVFDALKNPVGVPPSSYVTHQANMVLTLSSEWKYQNHQVDAVALEQGPTYHAWKLATIFKIRSHDTDSNLVRARVQIYQTELLSDGTPYVSKSKTLNVIRPLSWLDQHYQDGSATFLRAEALGLDLRELGTLLQRRYLPQVQQANLTPLLPSGIDNLL